MRKTSIWLLLFLVLALLTAVSAFQAGAEGFDWELEEDLYRLLTCGELTVAPESVMSVYSVDTVSFAETGVFAPAPLVCPQDGGSIYIAKLLTKDREFAGNLQYCVHDGSAHFWSMFPSAATASEPSDAEKHPGSCDPADNAARFEALFGKPVSTEHVQFVLMEGIGHGFYFPEERAMVCLAREGKEGAPEGSAVPVDGEELSEDAKRYKAYREENARQAEEWAKEHPGEFLSGYTGGDTANIVATGETAGSESQLRVPAYAWAILVCGSLAGVWLPAHSGRGKKRRIEEAEKAEEAEESEGMV